MTPRKLFVLSAVLTMLGAGAFTTAAQAAVPASLTGETLIQPGPGLPNGVTPTTYDCQPAGTSTVSFTASGAATGPYPGTFTETGTVTFGPQPINGFGAVTSFTATFSITSALGTVTGTKSLAPTQSTAVGFCNEIGGQVVLDASYVATISTPGGSIIDEGQANGTQFNICPNTATCGTIGSGSAFYESFLSDQVTVLPPPAPTSAEQCKNGGWATFATLSFKNQGDCVSYVQTHGKNEPGKNNPK
jgi:hypothetical protein